MWYLINAANPEHKYVLLADTEYVVGRRDCQVLVSGDAAVSRKHAIIHLTHPETCVSHPHKLSLVTLKDVSKFGTFLNKEQLKGETTIKDGDEMYFGSPKSTFMLVNEPYIITTSCLENVSKKRVKAIARTLGGHVVNEWRKDCSLLVMNHISVTIKVICAMVSLKAVVTPKYLEDLITHLKGEGPEPDTKEYLPPIAESQVNPDNVSFGADARRTTLFCGMKFIFLSQKQFKKMSLAIELAGGIPVLMEEGTDDNDDEVLTQDKTVVMNCGPEEQQALTENGKKWLQHVHAYLKTKKKQLIQDSEVGYAVLYSSTERHCNPNINAAQHLMPLPSQSLSERIADPSQVDVLVENTDLSQQTTRQERSVRKPMTAGKKEMMLVSKVKSEPISQDVGTTLQEKKRTVRSSVIEDSDVISRPSEGQMIKQEETKSFTSTRLKKNAQSSKSPSPEPGNASVKTCQRPDRSPSPKQTKETAKTSTRNNKSSNTNVRETDIVSDSHIPNLNNKSTMDLTIDDRSEKNGAGSRSDVLSKSTKKGGNLSVLDDSDDDDVGLMSSKKVAPSSSKRKRANFDPFGNSDDDDIDPISSRPAAAKSRRGNLNPFEDSGDESDVAKPSRSHESKRKRPSSDEDETFLQGRAGNKKKCAVLIEDSEFSTNLRQSTDLPSYVTVKQEKDDKRDVISTLESQSHLVCDTETASVPVSDRSPRKYDVKQEPSVKNPRTEKIAESWPVVNGDVPLGFLTTRKPIKHQVVKSELYEKELDLPESIVVTVFVDLVKRPVQPKTRATDKDVPDGCVKWKGKIVKNFKKFRKVGNMGSNRLPNIIGGSDLVAHTGSQHKDLDDWCKDALQAESQQNEQDRQAQDLFNWEPSTTRRKHSR